MTHYDVSSQIHVIANVWKRWADDERDNQLLLDGSDDTARRFYETAKALAEALLGLAVPETVDLEEYPVTDWEGRYAHPVLDTMVMLCNDPQDEESWYYPVPEFCRRYGFDCVRVDLESDAGETADALRRLLEDGGDAEAISKLWRPQPPSDGSPAGGPWTLILKEPHAEDGPYAFFAREAPAGGAAPAERRSA